MIRNNHARRLIPTGLATVLAVSGVLVLAAPTAEAAASTLPDLGAATRVDEHTVSITAGAAKVRITAHTDDTLRVEVAPDGTFTDPNAAPTDPTKPDAPMVVDDSAEGDLALAETDAAYRLSTSAATLTITKTDPRMTLSRADGTVLLQEDAPLSWDTSGTTQTLKPRAGEHFFGAGEQNGGYNHTGKTIQVANSFNWNEGGYNNSQPYYVSTSGYGVFRNTFQPGTYVFGGGDGLVRTTEKEQRFDAYYFVGDVKKVVDSYTDKPLHPRGAVVTGTVLRHGGERSSGVAWLDEAGEDPVIVRLSRAVGPLLTA